MCLSVMYPSLIAMFTFDWMDLRGVCDGVTCNMGYADFKKGEREVIS